MREVGFQNTSTEPATVSREILVSVDDGDQVSEPAVSTIYVNDIGTQGLQQDTGLNTADDTLHGNADGNTLSGPGGDDVLHGDDGNDFLIGGTGYDTMFGGDGDDLFTFQVGNGQNVVPGGAGGWSDVISIECLSPSSLGTDWTTTLDSGEIVSQDVETLNLREEAVGNIDIFDGTRFDFS